MIDHEKRQMLMRRFKNPDESPPQYPKEAIFCELKIRMIDDELILGYRRSLKIDLGQTDPAAVFNALLIAFATDNLRNNPTIPGMPTIRNLPKHWKRQPHVQPFSCDLSLDINDLCYVVIMLPREKNWQFARIDSPITVPIQPITHPAATPVAWEARLVNDDGITETPGVPAQGGNPAVVKQGFRTAYFIVDGRYVAAPSMGTRKEMPFNLHIEVLSSNGTYIPIIIDPDVGYPGGSNGRP